MSRPGREIEVASVFRKGSLAGRISRTRQGSVFEYDPAYLAAPEAGGIAFHLPATGRRFETVGVNLHTFFAGLLPEGLRLAALVQRLKTSPDDLLSILIEAGPDSIGDVSVVAEGEHPGPPAATVDLGRLDRVRFRELFEESLGAAAGPARERASIPGVQEKLSAAVISFPVRATPAGSRSGVRRAASYLLKLEPPGKPRLVQNEEFFLRMARGCGVDAATASVIHDAAGEPGLLVERFDRLHPAGSSAPVKLHQEDGCQFLDRYPADKYRLSCAELAAGIAAFSSAPVVDVAAFVRLVAFSYLIGNGDLHAKNVSLRVSPGGLVTLSPAYDLCSTLPYGDRRMALKLDGRDDHLDRGHLARFAGRLGVRAAATEAILDELHERSGPWLEQLGEIGLEPRLLRDLRAVTARRRAELVATPRGRRGGGRTPGIPR